jgi:transposase-like protein
MNEERQDKYLSKTERLRFDALANWNTIKAAAHSIGLDPQTLYNWKCQVRQKYKKRRGWINAVLSQTKRGSLLKDLLHEKRKMKPPEDDEGIALYREDDEGIL